MYLLIGIVATALGAWIMYSANKKKTDLLEYEFNNTTDGGVVQFSDYKESLRHEGRKRRADLVASVGILLTVVGVAFVLVAISGR